MSLEEQLADAARTYWRQTYPKEVVAFFFVKSGSKRSATRAVMYPSDPSGRDYDHVEFMGHWPDLELASPIRIVDLDKLLIYIQDKCLDNFE